MKNELGIEVCCENCYCINDTYKNCCMRKDIWKYCKENNFKHFLLSWEAMEARIKELQEQVKELEAENNGLNEYYQEQQVTNEEAYARIDRLAKKVNLRRTTLKQNK